MAELLFVSVVPYNDWKFHPSNSILHSESTWLFFASYRFCKFGNFRENFIFANSFKRHICDVKIRDYSSVNDRVISPFPEDFIYTKLRSFAKIKPSQIFPNLQKILSGTISECQSVWIQIRTNIFRS